MAWNIHLGGQWALPGLCGALDHDNSFQGLCKTYLFTLLKCLLAAKQIFLGMRHSFGWSVGIAWPLRGTRP